MLKLLFKLICIMKNFIIVLAFIAKKKKKKCRLNRAPQAGEIEPDT